MRRIGASKLMRQIADPENVLRAWRSVVGRQEWNGSSAAEHVSSDLAARRISSDLLSGRYQAAPAYRRQLVCPTGARRLVTILTPRDTAVQKAFLQILGPLLDTCFMGCSHAYRKGRGVDSAVGCVLQYAEAGHMWVVDADVADFFDSVSHVLLRDMLDQDIRVSDVCSVLHSWFMDAPGVARGHGLVQGAVISPLLSNVYLHRFDRHMSRITRNLVRYSDDFLVLCRTREEAKRCLLAAEKALVDLGLKLHPSKTRIVDARTEGFRFLGHTFVPGESHSNPRSEGSRFNSRAKRSRFCSCGAGWESATLKRGPAWFDERTCRKLAPAPTDENGWARSDSEQRFENLGHSVGHVPTKTGGRLSPQFSAGERQDIGHTSAGRWTLIDDPWLTNPPELDS